MRINLRISANKELVPFTYQHLLTGAIHKWLGDNQDHELYPCILFRI